MKSATVKVSATSAARNLSDLLSRVRYRGERFTVVRGGEEVADIVPTPDDDFAADLARTRAEQPPAAPSGRS